MEIKYLTKSARLPLFLIPEKLNLVPGKYPFGSEMNDSKLSISHTPPSSIIASEYPNPSFDATFFPTIFQIFGPTLFGPPSVTE